jgi:hypothetical protein
MPPPHSPPLHSGDAVSPIAKAKKTAGLPLTCSKKHLLSVNGYPRENSSLRPSLFEA